MLPLRFPNSGIRAKIFVRKIGFKLCMMRLNRIESFYVFLLYFCNKRSKDRGQSTTARLSAGVVGHSQAPYKGGRPWLGHLQGGGPPRLGHLQGGDRLWPRPPAKGRPTAAKAPYKGVVGCYQGQPARATIARGHSHLQPGARKERRQRPAHKGRPQWPRLPLAGVAAVAAGAATDGQGQPSPT
ncbi:hypothetical protein GW17_00054382 [Ensete ventricosum]|nr:hypothetical protein GW17_00054382 [Ensete ventricosum]RZS26175.1 hypothetical protein BHM03_00059481 [Ensete ventricosum]